MKNTTNHNPEQYNSLSDEVKVQNSRLNMSKFEYDLYHEEDDIVTKIFRVKKTSISNKNEKWKIFEDNKVIFIIEGSKLTNKEKKFLSGVDGFNFLIAQAKSGIKSLNALKCEIKQHLT